MILSDLVFGRQPDWNNVKRQGIEHISLDDIQVADDKDQRIKLVATIEEDQHGDLVASVHPKYISSAPYQIPI